MSISMEDLYWAAGFLEGEGAFHATPRSRNREDDSKSYNLVVSAGQRIYDHNMHTGWPILRWQVCGRRAVALMLTLWTLMSTRRREQIELSIQRFKMNAQPLSSYRLGR